jgi:hypothetical protein
MARGPGGIAWPARTCALPTLVAASAVQGILDRFCGGSIERALLALADAALVEPKTLAAIAGKLKRKPQ